MDSLHEVAGDAGLWLRPGARPGVLRIPALADRDPFGSEVPVQVDAAAVLTNREAPSVGVEDVHDPELDAGGRSVGHEPVCDLRAFAFVSVDAPDDEDAVRRRGIADVVDSDLAPSHGFADHLARVRGEAGAESECGEEDSDAHECWYADRRPRGSRIPSVRSLCLIIGALVACGFASPFATPEEFVPRPEVEVSWRDSRAVGVPEAGRLIRGVRFPAAGPRFFTWDPLLHRRPDRAWRRWGTDDLVRTILQVIDRYAARHPFAPRLGIGDLSRPRGAYFGPRHVSHQNGLDVDVYYPRLDRRERAPRTAAQIDRRLSQTLVDLFVRAGAIRVFVGPNTALTGPPNVVQVLWNHDNHLHVRMPPSP
jgi:hypothetical protein